MFSGLTLVTSLFLSRVPHPQKSNRSPVREAVESPRADVVGQEKLARLVREEAESLRLKSTLMGPNPMAVIESSISGQRVSRTLRPGDRIDGFLLLTVESRLVVLEKHGERIELER